MKVIRVAYKSNDLALFVVTQLLVATSCLSTDKLCWRQWRIQKFWKRGDDNLSAPSSFVANVHNEIYAFYTEKMRIFRKKYMTQ